MMEAEIFINQIGYRPQDKKTVFVSGKELDKAFISNGTTTFAICDAASGKEVFSAALVPAPDDKESGGG